MSIRNKNFRKIPDSVRAKAVDLAGQSFTVGCVKRISPQEIASGAYAHLGIYLTEQGSAFIPPEKIPDHSVGRFSKRNFDGFVIVPRDLPKVIRYEDRSVPNFGDPSKGSHIVSVPIRHYPTQQVLPQHTHIRMRQLAAIESREGLIHIVQFCVGDPLLAGSEGFDEELFRRLNVLRENVGEAMLFRATRHRSPGRYPATNSTAQSAPLLLLRDNHPTSANPPASPQNHVALSLALSSHRQWSRRVFPVPTESK